MTSTHSPLEENTRLSELMLKDTVTNKDVCALLDEIWGQYLETSKSLGKNIHSLKNPYIKIKEKLTNNTELDKEELDTLLETGSISSPMLQRKFGISYSKSSALMDLLELNKIISEDYSPGVRK